MQHPPLRGGPTPPPRDPAIVRSFLDLRSDDFSFFRPPRSRDADDPGGMSSDSGSSPTRRPTHQQPPHADNPKRRSSYENVQRPPSCPTVRRSTPSPSRAAPCWGSGDEGGPVRRRPASACGQRAPRQHRGSMPPSPQVECRDVYRTWGGGGGGHHGGCGGCCGAAPVQPYHWCGGPQTWGHYHHPVSCGF